jgi:hypothetical protein
MRKISKAFLITCLIAAIYAIGWYVLAINICAEMNKYIRENNKIVVDIFGSKSTILYDKVAPYGFPFKIGMKFINLVEDTGLEVINHKGLVTFGYDLFRGGVFFSNNGESIVKIKPQVSGFGVRVVSRNELFLKLPLSRKIFKIVGQEGREFEFINFIKGIEFRAYDVKAYDLLDDTIVFDHDYTHLSLEWERSYYYKNLQDVLSNIPQHYKIKADVKINEIAANKSIIAPPSIIYFLLPSAKFETEIALNVTTKAKNADMVEFLQSMIADVQKFNFISPAIDSKILGIVALDDSETRKNCKFNFAVNATINHLKDIASTLKNYKFFTNESRILSGANGLFDQWPDNYSVEFATEGNYMLSPKLKNLNFDNLDLRFEDDFAMNFKSQSSFSSMNNWYIEGTLIISNFEKISNLVALLLLKNKKEPLMFKNVKEAINIALRSISLHPESNSPDLSIDFQLSHNLGASKISNMPLKLLVEKYYKLLTQF